MQTNDRYGFIVAGIRQAPAWLRGALFVSVIAIVVFLARGFDRYEMYILEPGLDQGLVLARAYSWWGLSAETYELARMATSGGDISWHVRRRGVAAWQPLYGPDESGNLVPWFPRE